MNNVTVIIPVYKDWNSLSICIDSLQKYLDNRHQVLIINDMSDEWEWLEEKILQKIEGHLNYRYTKNSNNLGFVKTCNKAVLELDQTSHDIFLLNSDTEVTEGFLEEMLEVLYSDEKIGVVCPRSNNATFLSIPLMNNLGRPIKPEESYAIFQQLKMILPKYNKILTGVGFAFLIKRVIISKIGLFDEIFGMGYNEENDFCMRMHMQGFYAAMANRAYVYHLEGKSFGLRKEKMELFHSSILLRRYPEYWELVEKYERIYRDPVDYFGDLIADGLYKRKRILFSLYEINLENKSEVDPIIKIIKNFSVTYKDECEVFLLVHKNIKNIDLSDFQVVSDLKQNGTYHLAVLFYPSTNEIYLDYLNYHAVKHILYNDKTIVFDYDLSVDVKLLRERWRKFLSIKNDKKSSNLKSFIKIIKMFLYQHFIFLFYYWKLIKKVIK